MGRLIGSSLLVLTLLIALPSDDLHGQQKDKKKKMDAPEAIDSAKLSSGEFVGTLKSTPGSDRNFVVTVETKKLVNTGKGGYPKAGGNNNNVNRVIQLQQTILRDQQQLQTARTPQQRYQYQQRLLRDQQQLQQAIIQLQNTAAKGGDKNGLPPNTKIDTIKQDVDFQAADAIKVRTMLLPEAFDDKGNKKSYTKDQLAELKGKDKAAVGYESSLEKLEAGAKVRVVLGPAPVAKKEEKDKGKDVDKDDVPADKRMQAKMIVILEEAPPTKGKNPPKKK